MAIEDAWVLAEHAGARAVDGRVDWDAALAAYEAVRPEHCRRVLTTARAWGELWHLDGEQRRPAQRVPAGPRRPRLRLRRLALRSDGTDARPGATDVRAPAPGAEGRRLTIADKEVWVNTLDVPGATLRYRTAGEGPPLVLVHGSATDLTTWDGVVDDLARDHRVIAYDRRGYGVSTHRPVRDHRVHARDLTAVLEQRAGSPRPSSAGAPAATSRWRSRRSGRSCSPRWSSSRPRSTACGTPTDTSWPPPLRLKLTQLRGRRVEAAEVFYRFGSALRSGGNSYDRAPDDVRRNLQANAEPVLAEWDPHPFGVMHEHLPVRSVVASPCRSPGSSARRVHPGWPGCTTASCGAGRTSGPSASPGPATSPTSTGPPSSSRPCARVRRPRAEPGQRRSAGGPGSAPSDRWHHRTSCQRPSFQPTRR